jgi:hypothetical protein
LPIKTSQKNARLLNVAAVLIFFMAAFFVVAGDSYAWSPTPPNDPIGTNYTNTACPEFYGFTRRIVQCVRDTVLASVNDILAPMFANLYDVAAAVATLAVALWGFLVATGMAAWPLRQGFMLAIKIAVLFTLFGTTTYNFPYFYTAALDGLDDLLSGVTGYVNVSSSYAGTCDMPNETDASMMLWNNVDCMLDILIGEVIPNSSIIFGLGGFFLASLLTNAVGVFIGLLGFLIIVLLLFSILRALYIFVLAYVAFSLMALVSPIFLPMMLFRATFGYFEKWLKLSIGFILQPIFLFVYLTMLLAAFDTVIYTGPNSLFNTITGDQFSPGCDTGTGSGSVTPSGPSCPLIGEWLVNTPNIYTTNKHGNFAVNYDPANATAGCTGSTCSSSQISSEETGVSSKVGEVTTSQNQWQDVQRGIEQSIYTALGIDKYFFQVNMPTKAVDWNILAFSTGNVSVFTPAGIPIILPNTQGYIVNLLLSAIMAVATAYIFMLLLDALPFIGSGIMSYGVLGTGPGNSGFGFGNLAPPGANLVDALRRKVFKE